MTMMVETVIELSIALGNLLLEELSPQEEHAALEEIKLRLIALHTVRRPRSIFQRHAKDALPLTVMCFHLTLLIEYEDAPATTTLAVAGVLPRHAARRRVFASARSEGDHIATSILSRTEVQNAVRDVLSDSYPVPRL